MAAATSDLARHNGPEHVRWAMLWLAGKHSRNTCEAYHRDITAFFAWCSEVGIDPLMARRPQIDLFRRHLEAPRVSRAGKTLPPYAPTTVARKLTSVSAYYTYVVQQAPHLLEANPARHVDRPDISDESTTVGLDRDEAAAMIAAADEMGRCESAAVRLLLTTGLRVSEVCGASTSHMATERGYRVLVVTRKGGRRQKLPLSPATVAALDAYLGGRTGHIFLVRGTPMTRHQLAELVARVARAAGLGDKGITPHSLRHSATTIALDAGATLRDVQSLMGHIDPRTTNRYDRSRHNLDRSAVHVLAAVLDEPTP